MRVAAELKVCGECLQAIANGLDSLDLDEERRAEIESGMAKHGRHLVTTDEEHGFSRNDCQCCGSPFYGDRFGAAVLEPETAAEPARERKERPLVEELAIAFDALCNCQNSGNQDWESVWSDRIAELCKEHLPSGSGFDSGSTFDHDSSRSDCLVFQTSFHHMNESGFYDGWTEHRVIVRPAFYGRFDLKVTGRDKRQIKDYIADSFAQALGSMVESNSLA